ncbi:MAG TPA: hypothetical protein VKV03_02105 [Candidatus Binataceae bacterium]|nr:hypothetical protein [Candidatus Binataceae bacterium]
MRASAKSNGAKRNGARVVRWNFRSSDDLKEFWKKFQRVPARKHRTKRDEERYCLALYLLALATYRKLKYPLRIEEGESPDFMMTWSSGKTTGLEVTKATNMWVQREMTLAELEFEKRKLATAASGGQPRPVGIMLSQRGWVGDEAEREWLSFVRAAVENKISKFDNFRPASRQELLIYDDTPLPAIDRQMVLPNLSRWLADKRKDNPRLGHVSIIVSLDLLHDSGEGLQVLPFVNWSNPEATSDFGERIEFIGEKAVTTAVRKHKQEGRPIHFTDSRGRLVKEMPDGTRYEVRVEPNGNEVVIGELGRE